MKAILAAALVLSSVCAHAQTARARLDAFARDLHAVSASFVQQVAPAKGSPGKTSRGTLGLKFPETVVAETVKRGQEPKSETVMSYFASTGGEERKRCGFQAMPASAHWLATASPSACMRVGFSKLTTVIR